jgi:hypothetical protein
VSLFKCKEKYITLLEREEQQQCKKHVDQNVCVFSLFVCHCSKVIGSKGAEQENKVAAIWIFSWPCFG